LRDWCSARTPEQGFAAMERFYGEDASATGYGQGLGLMVRRTTHTRPLDQLQTIEVRVEAKSLANADQSVCANLDQQ